MTKRITKSNHSFTPKASVAQTHPINFPIVGIGASAGGLEAISQLLTHLPSHSGIALIIVQHLDPTHESLSAKILSKTTQMPVEEIKNGIQIQPNHVYTIPPNHNLALKKGVLKLLPRTETHGSHLTVNAFFQSLAQDLKESSIGIVLSGTGSDGTHGLEAIKSAGGLTIAQVPLSAKYDGMPQSAIDAGVVDLILTPAQIAEELVRFTKDPYLSITGTPIGPTQNFAKIKKNGLIEIFTLLRNQFHVDFSYYKLATLKRRITRRMILHKKERIEDYANFIQANPNEVRALFADILIHVTEFFRDDEAFTAFKKQILPELIKSRLTNSPIRIWIIGCSTGEEVYSVAISLLEILDETGDKTVIQIFATDISEAAIQKARTGVYPLTIKQKVSQDRLNRYFEKTDTSYTVNKLVRGLCLFSRHDVISDPPFFKINLICCRNILIYFDTPLQKRILPILHYALNPNGFLWLGKSESVGSLSTLFRATDKTNKFYLRSNTPTPLRPKQFGLSFHVPDKLKTLSKKVQAPSEVSDLQKESEQLLISEYAPPGVIINSNMEIIQTRGNTAAYLQLPTGNVSTHLFKMLSPEITPELRMAIQAAKKNGVRVTKKRLRISDRDQQSLLNITVIPFKKKSNHKDNYFWILFEPILKTLKSEFQVDPKNNRRIRPTKKVIQERDDQINKLNKELIEIKKYQISLTEDHEIAQNEIATSNDELQSTNEEFQSTNEELETAKEELQSINEELTTVNDELQNRNVDLIQLNNDLINLLGAIEFPIIMVASDGRIRRFTPTAGKLLNLIPNDIGRSIGDIKPGFDKPDLKNLVTEVIQTVSIKEYEVNDNEGHWFRLQARPYKTADDRIDGAVLSLIDITLLKHNLSESQTALTYASSVSDTLPLPLVVLDENLHLLSVNKAFSKAFEISPNKKNDLNLMNVLAGKEWTVPHFHQLLLKVITQDQEIKNYEVEHEFPGIGPRTLILNAKKISWKNTMPRAMLLSLEDISERKVLELALEQSLINEKKARLDSENAQRNAEKANDAKDLFLATLSHELRTPLTAILSWSQLLKRMQMNPEKAQKGLDIIEQSAYTQRQMIDDLLDISRIQTGKLACSMTEIEINSIVKTTIESLRPLAERKKISLQIFEETEAQIVLGDSSRLQQILWNLLTNSIKFSFEGSPIEIYIEKISEQGCPYCSIRIVDHGKGIDPEFLPVIFTRFSQQDSTSTRIYGGLGIGLALVRDLVKIHGGSVQVESPGQGEGATFTVVLPILPQGKKMKNHPNPIPFPQKLEVPELTGLTVLVVEDEPNSREVFSEIIKSYGGKTILSSSVREALHCFKIMRPDVILSDIALPLHDGYELIAKIRKLTPEQGGLVPAIALTAYAAQHDIHRAIAAGFEKHLTKPVDSEQLARTIAQLASVNTYQ